MNKVVWLEKNEVVWRGEQCGEMNKVVWTVLL